VESFHFVSSPDRIGRIFRTGKIRCGIAAKVGQVGHETPYLVDDPTTPWSRYSMTLSPAVRFFHCHYLRRSAEDGQMGRLRGWRKVPFPVRPCCGPWPDSLAEARESAPPRSAFAECLRLNVWLAWQRSWHVGWAPGIWRLRSWPPKDLFIP
jgi:hypothetical protein